MNGLGSFLWKIFSMTVIFLGHIGFNSALAETKFYVDKDKKLTDELFTSQEDATEGTISTITLCSTGYYLSSCGSTTLGTNWLKGMVKTKNVTSTITTPDYFSYDQLSTDTTNMDNLRKFFSGKETIMYTEDPIVSSDVIGSMYGAVVDGLLTNVLDVDGKQLVKVVAWYDNEMGYSAQMVRTAKHLMSK